MTIYEWNYSWLGATPKKKFIKSMGPTLWADETVWYFKIHFNLAKMGKTLDSLVVSG